MNHLYNYETPVLGRLMDERFHHDSQIDVNVPSKTYHAQKSPANARPWFSIKGDNRPTLLALVHSSNEGLLIIDKRHVVAVVYEHTTTPFNNTR